MRENVERVGAVDIDRNIDGSGECVYTVYCHLAESCGWRPARDGYGTHDIAEARVLAEAHMTMRHAPQTVTTCDELIGPHYARERCGADAQELPDGSAFCPKHIDTGRA